MSEIMSKRFYFVVPYSPVSNKPKNFFTRVRATLSPTTTIRLNRQKFERYREELLKRVEYVGDALSSLSLKSTLLDTQGLIELYYTTYNPDVASQEKLVELNQLQVEEEHLR